MIVVIEILEFWWKLMSNPKKKKTSVISYVCRAKLS